MGIGTLLSGGVVKCDNCGVQIKGQSDSMGGLGLFVDIGRSIGHHFCSSRCKREWEAAHGSDDSGSGDSSEARRAEAEAKKAEIEAEREEARIEAEEERVRKETLVADTKDTLEAIQSCNFDGDAASIVKELSNLLILIDTHKPPNIIAAADMEEIEIKKKVYHAGLEKFEFGIVQLRAKGDTANAEYFEKKYYDRTASGFSKAKGALGGLFGKKK